MTDAQLVTLATAFLAAMIAVLFNNSRITDLRTTMDKRFDDSNRTIADLERSLNRHLDDKFSLLMGRMQRMEDNLTHQLANHEDGI